MTNAELEARAAALVAAGDVVGAALLWQQHGEHLTAAALFERACAFDDAARAALAADKDDALRLALLGGNQDLIQEVSASLQRMRTPAQFCDIAQAQLTCGFSRQAGRMFEAVEAWQRAADAYQQHGDVLSAVRCFEHLQQPAPAARLLEAALRDGGLTQAAPLRLALGKLYHRHGKHRAALRALQQLPEGSAAWRAALPALAGSLRALGLREALQKVEAAMAQQGMVAESAQTAPDSGATAAGGVLFGRYRIEREVATTAHARLLKAHDPLTDRDVAVKLLVATTAGVGRDALQRFLREAQALANLRHPHVMPLIEVRPHAPAMILPWMAGGDLRALITAGTLAPARACEIAQALLSALAQAHRLGIVHRDVKPSNVLFDNSGTPYLADFGAAHLSTSAATVTVGEIGTYTYMPPEQRAGQAAVAASDVFSVGVMLYEMITGVLPPAVDVDTPWAFHHPDLNAQHDAVLAQLCATRIADRVSTAHQASALLAAQRWSKRVMARSAIAPRAEPAASEDAAAGRLVAIADTHPPVMQDTLLSRRLRVLPLTERLRAWASAVARAAHPSLPLIAKLDVEANQLWVVEPPGDAVERVTTADVEHLRGALQAVHHLGAAYGALSLSALRRVDGQLLMGYHPPAPDATPAGDVVALDGLPRDG